MGEFELLALLRERLPEPGPQVRLGSGDDAAISVPVGATATSVDALVEGVHFRRETASLIGRRSLRRGPAISPGLSGYAGREPRTLSARRRQTLGPRGWVFSHSSREGSLPALRAAMTHWVWACRRRLWSPSGNISMCSLSAGRWRPHSGQR